MQRENILNILFFAKDSYVARPPYLAPSLAQHLSFLSMYSRALSPRANVFTPPHPTFYPCLLARSTHAVTLSHAHTCHLSFPRRPLAGWWTPARFLRLCNMRDALIGYENLVHNRKDSAPKHLRLLSDQRKSQPAMEEKNATRMRKRNVDTPSAKGQKH